MKKIAALFVLSVVVHGCNQSDAQEIPSKEAQIVGALQAAPEEERETAQVLGYDSEGKVVVLKEGTGNLICLADNPFTDGFNAAAYHKDLEPFMARGRALKLEGKSRGEIFDIRESEAKSGELKMPKEGATLHILFGPDGQYNPDSGTIDNVSLRYVVYLPWATAASTGLPTKPLVPGGPWIMDPGTHRAHIMISPPTELQNQ